MDTRRRRDDDEILYHPTAPVVKRKLSRTGGYQSYLDPRQIFIGEYWDELSLPAFLVDSPRVALMLGLGAGAGIRPALAAAPTLERIWGVDIDSETASSCRAYFDCYFPNVPLSIVNQSASDFLSGCGIKFDIIWIDLYSDTGYCEGLFQDGFFEKVAEQLSRNGVIAMNLAGCPVFLDPLNFGPIRWILTKIKAEIGWPIVMAPYRRNITIVLGPRPRSSECDYLDLSLCNPIDARALLLTKLRAHAANTIEIPEHDFGYENIFQDTQSEVDRAWKKFCQSVNTFLENSIGENVSLSNCLDNPELLHIVLPLLHKESDSFASLIPSMLGARSAEATMDAMGYVNETLRLWETLRNLSESRLTQYTLPQAAAVVLHRYRRGGCDYNLAPIKEFRPRGLLYELASNCG